MKKLFLAGAIAAGLMAQTAGQAAYVETRHYILGFVGEARVHCIDPETNIGGGCFTLGAQRDVTVTITDQTGLPTGFSMRFVDAAGQRVGDFVNGCQTKSATAPAAAVGLQVLIDGPNRGPANCLATMTPGVGTIGEIEVAFE